MAQQVLSTAALVARLPQQLDSLSTLLQRGQLSIEIPGVDRRLHALERLAQRAVSAVVFAGLLLGGIFLRPSDPVLGNVLMIVSILPLLHALFAGMMSRNRPH